MQSVGLNLGYLLVLLLNVILLAGWIILAIVALFQLRVRSLNDTAKVIWVTVILLVPIFGAIAFWIIRPGLPGNESHE